MSKSSRAGCAKLPPSVPRWQRYEGKPYWSLLAQAESNRVLTDGDEVAVGELLLDHWLSVYQRAVCAAKVADPERSSPNLDAAVPARGGGIPDHDVVVRRPSYGDHLIR